MKLLIKKKYFDLIKKGKKIYDFRDAHITFICEETGETLKKEVVTAGVFIRTKDIYPDVLNDKHYIKFGLKHNKHL